MITSGKGNGDGSGGTQVYGGIEVEVDPLVSQGGTDITVSPDFKTFLSFPVCINGEMLASIVPALTAMMKMGMREALRHWRGEGTAAPVRIT